MSQPRLLLLDEPTLGLAPLVIAQIFDIIRSIREQGVTVFLVEQNANKALGVADRGYVLETAMWCCTTPALICWPTMPCARHIWTCLRPGADRPSGQRTRLAPAVVAVGFRAGVVGPG